MITSYSPLDLKLKKIIITLYFLKKTEIIVYIGKIIIFISFKTFLIIIEFFIKLGYRLASKKEPLVRSYLYNLKRTSSFIKIIKYTSLYVKSRAILIKYKENRISNIIKSSNTRYKVKRSKIIKRARI